MWLPILSILSILSSVLHLVKAIQGPRFQIGNNRGRINGWITCGSIYGKCIEIAQPRLTTE